MKIKLFTLKEISKRMFSCGVYAHFGICSSVVCSLVGPGVTA